MLKFPQRIIECTDNWQSIPFSTGANSDAFLSVFRTWAIKSDIRWNTVGLSQKLFSWV
jgi:hypothetical protein